MERDIASLRQEIRSTTDELYMKTGEVERIPLERNVVPVISFIKINAITSVVVCQ
jgi:hypothetical protein